MSRGTGLGLLSRSRDQKLPLTDLSATLWLGANRSEEPTSGPSKAAQHAARYAHSNALLLSMRGDQRAESTEQEPNRGR